MKQRDILQYSPALMALPAVGMASPSETETPVMQIFREWEKARDFVNSPKASALSEDEFNIEVGRCCDIEEQMMAVPAQNAQDVLAKIEAWTGVGGFELPSPKQKPEFWAELHKFIAE